MQSEAAVHLSPGEPATDSQQPSRDQGPQAGGSTDNAAAAQNDAPAQEGQQAISPVGYLQV